MEKGGPHCRQSISWSELWYYIKDSPLHWRYITLKHQSSIVSIKKSNTGITKYQYNYQYKTGQVSKKENIF